MQQNRQQGLWKDFNVDYIAKLSNLQLSPEEKEKMAREMEKIVAFAGQLQNMDTGDGQEEADGTELVNVFRKDKPESSFSREELFQNAPEEKDGYFFVPQVVE